MQLTKDDFFKARPWKKGDFLFFHKPSTAIYQNQKIGIFMNGSCITTHHRSTMTRQGSWSWETKHSRDLQNVLIQTTQMKSHELDYLYLLTKKISTI